MSLALACATAVSARIPTCCTCWRVQEEEAVRVRQNILDGDRREVPGLVRVSFGLYNRTEEIDCLVEALETHRARRDTRANMSRIPPAVISPHWAGRWIMMIIFR